MVPEAKEEVKPQRHKEEEQQGCPHTHMRLLRVLAPALLPGKAERPQGLEPHLDRQKQREEQRQRSRESVCLHRLRDSASARHPAGVPEENPVGHLHVPVRPGDVAEIVVQTERVLVLSVPLSSPALRNRSPRGGSPFWKLSAPGIQIQDGCGASGRGG